MYKPISNFFRWFSNLSVPEVYGTCAAILLASWLIYLSIVRIWFWAYKRRYLLSWHSWISRLPEFWRRIIFVHLPNSFRWLDISTCWQALALAILLAANILALRLRATSLMVVQKRAGSLAVISIAPLCTGLNFGFPADLLCIDRQSLGWFHRWIGRICVFHSLLHGIIIMSTTEASIFITPRYIFPIIAGGSLILIVPVTCAAIRTRHVQFALKCHYLLAVVATSTLGYHLLKQQSLYRWVLLGALCLWAVTSLTVSISTVWSRKPWRHDRQEVSMNASNGLLWLEVDLPPTWAVQPGQYVQLWMPSAGIRAGLQLPIFYVAVCKKDGAYKIARMVARSRSGIIRKLYDRNLASPRVNRIPVTVLGPYGRPENLLRFGTVVLVVEDVGFFRALSYIEMLVKASVQRKALVRKLEILWQDDGESNYPPWVKEWRQEVLCLDHPTSGGFDILQFKIYCGRADSNEDLSTSYQEGNRLCFYRDSLNIEKEIRGYIKDQRGDMAVAGILLKHSHSNLWGRSGAVLVLTIYYIVCAGYRMRETVRKTIQPHIGSNLKFIALDLGPYHAWPENNHYL